jgi:hypothetical protein
MWYRQGESMLARVAAARPGVQQYRKVFYGNQPPKDH